MAYFVSVCASACWEPQHGHYHWQRLGLPGSCWLLASLCHSTRFFFLLRWAAPIGRTGVRQAPVTGQVPACRKPLHQSTCPWIMRMICKYIFFSFPAEDLPHWVLSAMKCLANCKLGKEDLFEMPETAFCSEEQKWCTIGGDFCYDRLFWSSEFRHEDKPNKNRKINAYK